MLGRFSVPSFFLRAHSGDSGRNGRMIIRGIAGMTPAINVYRQDECPVAEAEPLASLVKQEMEGVATLAVPLTVEVGVGRTWLEAH